MRKEHKVSVICNPSTGQSLTLPKLKTRKRIGMRSYLGYEPINKQYKVLSMTWKKSYGMKSSEEHQFLTLETGGELLWRRIECCIPHSVYHDYNHVCIDGIMYYPALKKSSRDFIIILFDFRSEKFRFVKNTDPVTESHYCKPLINYNGKLGLLGPQQNCGDYIHRGSTRIWLWVLEDAEKHEWSTHMYNIVGGEDALLRVVGVTRTNEIVFSFAYQSTPFYVFYYNTERNTIRRVEIQGLEAFKLYSLLYTFLDHVEDVSVKLTEGFSS